MADRKDILDINPIMSIRNKDEGWNLENRVWSDKLPLLIGAIDGNRVGVYIKNKGLYEMMKDKWINGRFKVGASDYKVTGHDRYTSIHGLPIPLFWLTLDTLPSVTIGDKAVLEWDIARLPKEWWDAGKDIFRSSFYVQTPGFKGVPSYFTGTFHQCDMTNHELHAGCTIEGGDGLPCPNNHYAVQKDKEVWRVEKDVQDGQYKPVEPLDSIAFDQHGLSRLPVDIVATPLNEPITVIADKAKGQAVKDNAATFNVAGQTLTNPDFIVSEVK